MTNGHFAGQNVDVATLASYYAGYEAYAWVGVVYTGSAVSGSVTSVNGHSVGNRTMSLTPDSSGNIVASNEVRRRLTRAKAEGHG
jgi:hypothetical protein